MKIGDVITINPKLASGTPVFKGTCIPLGRSQHYETGGGS